MRFSKILTLKSSFENTSTFYTVCFLSSASFPPALPPNSPSSADNPPALSWDVRQWTSVRHELWQLLCPTGSMGLILNMSWFLGPLQLLHGQAWTAAPGVVMATVLPPLGFGEHGPALLYHPSPPVQYSSSPSYLIISPSGWHLAFGETGKMDLR